MFVLFEKEYLPEGHSEFALCIDSIVRYGKQGEDTIALLTEDNKERSVTLKDEASRDKYWDHIMERVGVKEPACLGELMHLLENHPERLKVIKVKKPAKKKVAKKKSLAKKPLIMQLPKKKVAKKK